MSTKHRALGTQKWKNKRLAILQRDGYECYVCGGQADQVDHLIPRSKDASKMFDDDNLLSICGRCNRAKGSRFFRGGFDPLVLPDLSLSKTDTLVPESPFEKP
jgi:5-methylcytosine-specific restriction endonuclease McrA